MEVVMDHRVDVPSEVEVELRLPDDEERIQIKGQLVRSLPMRTLWDRLRNQQARYVIGINFMDMDSSLRSRIIRKLQQITR